MVHDCLSSVNASSLCLHVLNLPLLACTLRLLDQVEGAIRNVLFLLGLPTIVMGSNEEDVVEACGFVIRHAFGLYTGRFSPYREAWGCGRRSRSHML